MTRRRSQGSTGHDVSKDRSDWQPARIIQVDVDVQSDSPSNGFGVGQRLWIEVVKKGQVIGVLQAFAPEGMMPQSLVDDIREKFKDAELSLPTLLANELLPKASVIVPTIVHRPRELVRTVESLLSLDYPNFEIIVIDNRSRQNHEPMPVFPSDERIRVYAQPKPGTSAARNLGIEMATGEFLAFTDDDAAVATSWLRVLGTRFMLDPDVGGIGGLVLPFELETQAQMWFEEYYGGFSPSFRFEKLSIERLQAIDPMFPYAVGRFGPGCNMAFRRSVFDRIGGFDIRLGGGTLATAGEDVAFDLKFVNDGGTFAFEPAALVRHTHRRSRAEFLSQAFSYGTGLTAMYTAMIVRDPRHIYQLARRVPFGLRHLIRPSNERSSSIAPSYPRRTILYQLAGFTYGPFAYFRSFVETRHEGDR